MYDTVVLATDGSASTERAVRVGLDLVKRFDGTVHGLYVLNASDIAATPEAVRQDLRDALRDRGQDALAKIAEQADSDVITSIREGKPATEICAYAESVEADVIVTGTRGRHGEHAFLLGSVAEAVVRQSPIPVLTVRQLEADEHAQRRPQGVA
ncbi:universal stress protein [Halorhabdus sp. CBA1104]|uniref:universal stress protein n=1 Tax=Halorhabdus sp. CBA1104 TaxID=1380432 RepID=UPI0012B1B613|nr:universal stress protein [Halorhabdus sp. CBA1104]QGN07187.1 universal stress protein [Halorhabdus sp. CBA1104]